MPRKRHVAGRTREGPAAKMRHLSLADWNSGSAPALAGTATTPRPAAAAATAATAASAPTATASATATAAATAAPPGGLFAELLGGSGLFLVEHIEGRQADIRNLLLPEEELMLRRGGLRRNIRRRSTGCRRRPTGHSKRHAGDSQNRDGLTPTVSLRRLLSARHLEVLPYLWACCSSDHSEGRHSTLGISSQASNDGSRATLTQLHNGILTAAERDSFPKNAIFYAVLAAKMNSS